MKKILISATLILFGLMCNAAAVTWSVTSIQATPAGTTPTDSWICYVLAGDTYNTFVAYGTVGEKLDYIAKNNLGSASLLYNGRNKTYTASVKEGSYSASSVASGYMVIFDAANIENAKYMAYTTVQNATVGPTGADATSNFGTFDAAMSKDGSSGSWAPVPEPTSGLLILLGMAGLALRRKQK